MLCVNRANKVSSVSINFHCKLQTRLKLSTSYSFEAGMNCWGVASWPQYLISLVIDNL